MPQKLTSPIEDKVRQYIVNNVTPSEIHGYDPTQTDTTQSDFILVTSDNDNYGDYYPMIYVSESDGPTVPNSGTTNSNGLQGDGSGNNQYTVYNLTISVQAVENGPYLNNTDYDQLVFDIYQELKATLNSRVDISETMWVGELSPATQTREPDQQDSSTESWNQRQGTVPVGVQYTP